MTSTHADPTDGPGPATTCGDPQCACADSRRRPTGPNAVTLVRTVASLAVVLVAAHQESWPLLLVAYLVYWGGDMADGALARRLGQETRAGAVLDILCDRVNTVSCILTLLIFVPAPLPVAVFLVQFAVVDLVLSLQPMRWAVLSPNYFYRVDPLVYAWNWHPAAKVTNTALLVLLLVLVPDQRVALAAALAVLTVKVVSLVRVLLRAREDRPAHLAPVPGHATTGARA